ncbi:MAG: APC family permease [Rhodoluna sp.]|nr:APC family permease [Rhodoluna sp.]
MSNSSTDTGLRKGRLGVVGIVFFVVAAAAPLLGMTGAVPVAMLLGNQAGTPGTYLAVGLILLVFSVGYAAMSQKVTNTGAFFAYVGKGLGKHAGVASAFASLVGYITIQLAIYGFIGGVLSGQMEASAGIALPWYVWAVIVWVAVTALSLLSVDVGAKVLGVLMIAELLTLVITSTAVFMNHGSSMNIGNSFGFDAVFAGGFGGGAGIAIAFAFASFIGFEATAIYGEESKDPKKVVPKATYWAVGIITVLFAFTAFAMATAMGGTSEGVGGFVNTASDGLKNPAGVIFGIADDNLGGTWMSTIMGWLVISSCFAGVLAFQNAIARYFFALGRGGVLPKSLSKTNKAGAPVYGVILTSIFAIVVIVVFAVQQLDGIANLFTWMSAVTAVAIMFVEILVSIAIVVYLGKDKTVSVWKSTIAPIVAAIGLSVGTYMLMSRFNLLGGVAAEGVDPTTPEGAWQLTGFGWFLVLLPFIAAVAGLILSLVNNKNEKAELLEDILS